MDNKLSFTNLFNQQKIIANSSSTVSISSAGTLATYVTVATQELQTPTARVFVEFNGILAPMSSSSAGTFNTIGKSTSFYAFFNSANSLVIQAVSLDAYDVTIYYRIYVDGVPS